MRKDNVSVKNVRTTNVRTGEVKESRIQTKTPDERPNIWNLQAFVIVFLFIMLGTTINVYSVNNDNLTWVDSNGDFKLDSYNHSMINLDTDLIELNNQSLNDVFLDGNLISYQNINAYLGGVIDSLTNDIFTITQEDNNDFFRTNILISNVNSGNKVYSTATFKLISGSNIEAKITNAYGNTGPLTNPNDSSLINTSDWTRLSVISTALNTDQYWSYQNLLFYFRTNGLSSYNVKDIYYLDLTDLGIDNLSQAQMDEYYNLYVSLQENRIEAYKDLGNEPISQWQNLTQYLQVTIDAIMGPINNISDWINKFMQGLFS